MHSNDGRREKYLKQTPSTNKRILIQVIGTHLWHYGENMRNSRFTPRTTFAKKVMSITSKVMIFGVLLSLFLFACVGTDTLEEIAHAAQLSGYGDTAGAVRYRYGDASSVGENFSFYNFGDGGNTTTTTLIAGASTGADGNVNNRSGWVHNDYGLDTTVGWYVTFDKSAFWALKNGWLKIEAGVEMKEHATQNSISVSFYSANGTSKGSQIGGKTTSEPKSYGDYVGVTQDVTSMSKPDTGIAAYYTQLDFVSEDYASSWGFQTAGKIIKAEPVNSGITVKATRTDATAPVLDRNGISDASVIRVRDGGAGIRSIVITSPDGKASKTFNAPATPSNTSITAPTVTGVSNPTSYSELLSNPSFSDNTRYFQFTATRSGEYTMVVTDHFGKSATIKYTVPKYSLTVNANYPEDANLIAGATTSITIPDVINAAGVEFNTIKSIIESSSQAGGKALESLFQVDGYGIKGWSVVTNAELSPYDGNGNGGASSLDKDGATFKATILSAVTIKIEWEQMFTLRYNSNNGRSGVFRSNALEGSSMAQEVIPDSVLSGGVYRPGGSASDWAEFYKPGYYLSGWVNGAGAAFSFPYEAGTKGTSVDIYAVWEPLSFTVSYNGNGSNHGSMASTGPIVYGESMDIPAHQGFKKNHHAFTNWTFSATGTTFAASTYLELDDTDISKIGTAISALQQNVVDQVEASFTLTANWSELEYGIDWTNWVEGTSQWGSEDHPYIIYKSAQLTTTLTNIVNGTTSAVKGSIKGSTYAEQTNPTAQNGTYEFGHFVVQLESGSDTIIYRGTITSIGSSSNQFKGSFDGNGLTINYTSATGLGLFGYVGEGGHIKNVKVTGTLTGNGNYVGAIASRNAGTIENCGVTARGSVTISTSEKYYVGGIVGQNESTGIVLNCTMNGSVSGQYRVGGIVGYNFGEITDSNNSATVSGTNWVGGITGTNQGTTVDGVVDYGTITNCDNSGKASGQNYIGGIVGTNTATGKISGCDNSADVTTGTGTEIGGIVGRNEGEITASHNNKASVSGGADNSNNSYVGGIAGRSTGAITNCDVGVTSQVTISGTGNLVGGVVGQTTSTISDCEVNASVSGNYRVGGIAGQNDSTISNCTVSGQVKASQRTGGIAGYNTKTISNCENNATIIGGTQLTGGIAGISTSTGTITNCDNFGPVSGTINTSDNSAIVGGIVGQNEGVVRSCNNNATVTAAGDFVGGIVGTNGHPDNQAVLLTNCYNNKHIKGRSAVGGIVGQNVHGATIQYCVHAGSVEKTYSGDNNIGTISGNTWYSKYHYVFSFDDSYPMVGGDVTRRHDEDVVIGWTFTTNTAKVGNDNIGHYVIDKADELFGVGFANIKPMSASGRGTSWEDITSTNFTGFYVEGITVENAHYLAILSGDSFATPSDAKTTPNEENGQVYVNYIEFKDMRGFADITMSIEELRDEINGNATDITTTFDGSNKGMFSIPSLKDGYILGEPIIISGHSDCINATPKDDPVKFLATAVADTTATKEVVFGLRLYTITINPLKLSDSNVRVLYEGKVYGAEKAVISGNDTLTGIYDITNGGMIDYDHATTTGGKFYIAVATESGCRVLVEIGYMVNGSVVSGDVSYVLGNGNITFNHEYNYNNTSKIGENNITTFYGDGGNYLEGEERAVKFVIIGTDFGRLDIETGDSWGSEDNPYVISHWTHLVRLSEIVNKISDPIDSVSGYGIASDAEAGNVFFAPYLDGGLLDGQCYFVVRGTEKDLTIPAGITYIPIGGTTLKQGEIIDGTPYYVSFFGGNFDGTDNNSTATINLGSSLENYDKEYSGLFGLVKGRVINDRTYYATIRNIVVTADARISGSNFVGSLIGYAEKYVKIEYEKPVTNTVNVTGASRVGGFIGKVGLGVEMTGTFENAGTITATESYVGGIIGKLLAGAGKKSTTADNSYNFGDNTLAFINRGKVMKADYTDNTNYVGGIIGGTAVNTGNYSAVETIIQPAYMQNFGAIVGANYVGGFIGEVSDNVALHLTNTFLNQDGSMPHGEYKDVWSHNGAIDSNAGDIHIEGTASNVGGLVGKLSVMGHKLTGVFNTMVVIGGEDNIGGLVGTMSSGSIINSFVSLPGRDKITSSTSMVTGANSVGGLVGKMDAGTLDTSFAQGFNFGIVSGSRGGVVGVAQQVAKINNSWALYITGTKDSVDYRTTSSNGYGKYILTYDGHGTATISEMLVFAGIVSESAIAGNTDNLKASSSAVKATKGMISLKINLPASTDTGNYEERVQITFYDASGYENPFRESFNGAANDTNVQNLYIRLDASTASSLIIAATRVHFGTIANYGDKSEWENAYMNIGDEELYGVVISNAEKHKTDEAGNPLYDSEGNPVMELIPIESGSEYIVMIQTKYGFDFYDKKDENKEYTYVFTSTNFKKVYGKESDVAPYVISDLDQWQEFVDRIRGVNGHTKDTFSGKTVKLAADLTGVNKITKESQLAGTTDWTKNFMGTFDGDGHTIEIQFDYSSSAGTHAELGLFRGASGATFKNLTITGTIKADSNSEGTTGTNHIGAFVGRAHGSLTFENCTNDVDIIARGFGVGGFIGSTKLTNPGHVTYTFIGCVNTGNIVTYYPVGKQTYSQRSNRDSEKYGVGGFIGTVWNGDLNIKYNGTIEGSGTKGDGEPIYEITGTFASAPDIIMESCRNAGDIYGSYNVGGLIGYNGGSSEVMNCGNTGKVTAVGEGSFSVNKNNDGTFKRDENGNLIVSVTPSRDSRSFILTEDDNTLRVYIRRYLNAGGLVGLSTSKGHVDMYTSYNAGTVHAYGNTAGGLIGSDTEYTKAGKSEKLTKIYYCYNAGEVITGLDKYTVFLGSNKDYTDRYDASDNLSDQRLMKYYEKSPVMVDDEGYRNQGSIDHWEMTLRHETNVPGGQKREGGAFGTTVGGIIGSTTNTDIAYCYNIGTITCRGLAIYTHGSGTPGLSYSEYHARAGGIVGLVDSGSVKVRNSYSIGDIKLEARHATTGSFSLEGLTLGPLNGGVIKELRQTRPMYVAGIVGHDNANKTVDVSNCFSIKYQCHFTDEKNNYFRYHIEGYNNIVTGVVANEDTGDWYGFWDLVDNLTAGKIKHAKISFGSALNSEDENSSSGYVVSSVAQLTAIMDARGIVTMPGDEDYPQADKTALGGTTTPKTHYVASAQLLNHSSAEGQSDVRAITNSYNSIKTAAVGGWIFMPGCLPQLAPFALDTQDGLAMTSYGYGRNTQGEFVKQVAGSEFNPYIIKDGIELLGLSSLVAGGDKYGAVDFNNKYIEFANGTNNLAGDVCDSIKLPSQDANNNRGADGYDYIFFGNGKVNEGKSYQLYNRAANGLHGVKGASNQVSEPRTSPATSIKATKQEDDGSFKTDVNNTAYATWLALHHGYDGSKYSAGVSFKKHNINPIGYRGKTSNGTNYAFMGNISGALPNGKQTEILNLRVSAGYTVTDGSENNVYAGLFGLVKDANISNITVMGDVIAYGGTTAIAQAGVVAKAYGNTTLKGLSSGTENNYLNVLSKTGTNGYVGSIVGHADSGATGNRLSITNCSVTYAVVSTHLSGAGGIVGFTKGDDVSSFTDIIGCNVATAHIYSTTGFAVAGIIGNQGDSGAVAVRDCIVGHAPTKDEEGKVVRAKYAEDANSTPTSGVKIQGEFALGGIISYALANEKCTNSYTNCIVYDDVYIERTGHTDKAGSGKIIANNAEDLNPAYQYGSAIGGVAGGILDNDKGKATFSGIIAFYGTIDAGHFLNNKNIGGVVGYMGTSARMEQCIVEIGGTITTDATGDGENIGGFAGISKGVLLDGIFLVHPTMNVAVCDAVGGFIGYNAGDTNIARTATIYTAPIQYEADGTTVKFDKDGNVIPDTEGKVGNIVANSEVGGFIGHNAAGKQIVIGVAEYKGDTFGTDEDYTTIVLGSSVDGNQYVGGFIGYVGGKYGDDPGKIDARACQITNLGHIGAADDATEVDDILRPVALCKDSQYIGGVVGYIEIGGEMIVSAKATINNEGQVGHTNFQSSNQRFVGGIIGASFGTITIKAEQITIKAEQINKVGLSNMGSVYGYEYVGGAIGAVGAGTISGTLNNGVAPTSKEAEQSAYEGSEALVAGEPRMGTTASVTAVRNVGGVIGVVMQDAIISGAIMSNYGSVTADSIKYQKVGENLVPDTEAGAIQSIIDGDAKFVSNLGGVIGLHYGVIKESSQFSNYGHIIAENFAGGAIGVSDGIISDSSSFVNYATIAFRGDTALGGSVGYITNGYDQYYPVVDGYTYITNKNKSTVSQAHFSYEPMSKAGTSGATYDVKVVLQATGVTPYSGVEAGGLGGVFGVIDSTHIIDDKGVANWNGNTFFINGDVYGGKFTTNTNSNPVEDGIYVVGSTVDRGDFAGTVDNVGGVVGVIKGAYIKIDNMLVYNSNVGGKNHVGGIIGSNGSINTTSGETASIYNCYNVYGEVWAVDKDGNVGEAGGIVGDVTTSAKAYASYWVKAYTNMALQQSTPDDIANTLDKAAAEAWVNFISYAEYVNNVDIGDKKIEDITPDDLIVGKGTEDEHTITVEEYLNSTGFLGEHTGKLEWSEYVDENGEMTINGQTYTKNHNLDWGYFNTEIVPVNYNTGAKDGSTGYYFIYAEDGDDFAEAGITVDHSNDKSPLHPSNTSIEEDDRAMLYGDEALNFWLIIANSPNKIATESDGYPSVNVYDNDKSDGKYADVKPGIINAVAYTADRNGYYLYVKSSGTTENAEAAKDNQLIGTSMNYDEATGKVYISSNAQYAGNVMIFYKQYKPGKALEYNGFYRWATASEDLIDTYEGIPEGYGSGTNYYTLNNEATDRANGVNEARKVGSHHISAEIWTYSDDRKVTLGYVNTTATDPKLTEDELKQLQWKIVDRTVEVEFNASYHIDVDDNGKDDFDKLYTGQYSHYITMTATNIALPEEDAWKSPGGNDTSVEDAIMSIVKVAIEGNKNDIHYQFIAGIADKKDTTKDDIASDPGKDYDVVAYYAPVADTDRRVDGEHTLDTEGVGSTLANSHLFKIVYRIYAKNAGSYKVTASVPENKNHKAPSTSATLEVGKREITMDFTTSGEYDGYGNISEGYKFDGGYQYRGVQSIKFSGIQGTDIVTDVITGGMTYTHGVETARTSWHEWSGGTLNFFASDVGTYNASIQLNDDYDGNYELIIGTVRTSNGNNDSYRPSLGDNKTSWSEQWEVYTFTVPTKDSITIEGKNVVYNGEKHSLNYQVFEGSDSNEFDAPSWWKESINITIDLGGTAIGEYVNVKEDGYIIDDVTIKNGSFKAEVTRNGSVAMAKDPGDNYDLGDPTVSGDDGGQAVLYIKAREIALVWNDTSSLNYVYTGKAQGLGQGNIKLLINMNNDYDSHSSNPDWVDVTEEFKDAKVSLDGSTLKVSGILQHGSLSGETLEFAISGFTATDAGTYTAKVTKFSSATGKNDGGDTIIGNYSYVSSGSSDDVTISNSTGVDYTIAPSEIKVAFGNVTQSASNNKEFDNTTTVLASLPAMTITSNNGGAVPSASAISITSKDYYNGTSTVREVGTGYDFLVKYTLASGYERNYVLVGSGEAILDANAAITPRGIIITLNTTGGNATKVFDNNPIYAEVESDGNKTVKSSGDQFKPGRGITVEGFITSGVSVSVRYQEMGSGRSEFHAYVNNVTKDNSGNYYMGSGFYKQLQIVLNNVGGSDQMANYFIKEVRTKSGETLVSQSSDTKTKSTIRVQDSRADDSNTAGTGFQVTITPYSIKATYKNTAQSYANSDNTYNLDWVPVECKDNKVPDSFGLSKEQLNVVVNNGWMTDDSGNPQKYNKYKRIAGKMNRNGLGADAELGAYLESNAGYNFCFNLRTQPTLIIGYFVEQPDGYAIGTMAGLLIATEYYKGNFSTEDNMSYDFVQTIVDIKDKTLIDNLPSGTWNSWEELLAEVDYSFYGYVHNGTTYGPAKLYKDIDARIRQAQADGDTALVEALQTELASFEMVFEQLEGQASPSLQLVYWKAEEIIDGTKYKKFYLTNNIDGILTKSDIEMLQGAFGDSEFGVKWGAGTPFLGNVLFAEEGSVVIFNSSVFDEQVEFVDDQKIVYGFDGSFDGRGYTIDHLNITKVITSAEDGDDINVGMFAKVNAPTNPEEGGGYVTGLNFRNLTIYVVDNSKKNITINVGAVVGYNKSTACMQNITVHGTISVKSSAGTVNVGGIIGFDDTGYVDGNGVSAVIDSAIVVATIRAEGAIVIAGGAVGVMDNLNTSLTDIVSLSEIYAKGATSTSRAVANGFVGEYAKVVGGFSRLVDGSDYTPISTVEIDNKTVSSAFMDAIFTITNDNVYTRVGGDPTTTSTAYRYKYIKTYTDLYNGSMTAFEKIGNDYVYSNAVGQPYGIYDVVSEINIAVSAEAMVNTRGTMRLKDIVDIYVLGYGLTRKEINISDGTVATFKKETTSKYFHAVDAVANDDDYKPDGTAEHPILIAYQQHLSLLRMFNYMNFELEGDIKMYTGYNLAVVDEAFTGKVNANGHEVNFRNGTAGQMFVYQSNNGADTGAEEKTITYDWVVIDPQDEE